MLPNVRLSRFSAILIIAGAVLGSSQALAAPPKGKPQPAAPAPAPAPAAPAPPPSEALQNARAHFVAGVNLLRDPAKPRYEEAYREFKTAYSLSPAAQILGNLGLCAMMLERDSEAIEAYESYLKNMLEVPPTEKEQIERDLQTLKLGLVRVSFTSNVGDTTIIDRRVPTQGDAVNNVYGPLVAGQPMPLGIRQGHHIITARAPGKPEQVWEVDAAAGDLGVHAFEFPEEKKAEPQAQAPVYTPPPPPPERPIPKSFWYAAGGTGVLALGTVVMGLVAVNSAGDYNDANKGTDPDRASDLRGRTKAFNVTTDVLLVGTIAAAAITSVIFLTRPEKERAPAAEVARWLSGGGTF
jgi:hypothetical protein